MRRPKLLVGILAFVTSGIVCATVVLILVLAHDNTRLNRVTRQLQHTNLVQAQNRTHNVLTWCNAIDQQGAVIRSYVNATRKQHPEIAALHLKTLNCKALVNSTTKSSIQP